MLKKNNDFIHEIYSLRAFFLLSATKISFRILGYWKKSIIPALSWQILTANRQTHLFCFINYAGHKITFVHCSPLESFLWFPLKKQPQHYTKNVCGMWYYRIKMLQFWPYFFQTWSLLWISLRLFLNHLVRMR